MTSDELRATADKTANAQLAQREREARDRGWWRQMRDCYHPDAVVRVSWFQGTATEFVDESERMGGHGNLARHRLAATTVYLGSDRAVVTAGATIESRSVIDGVEADLVSYTRLLYRTERRDEAWRIAGLDCVYERDTLTPALPGQRLPLAAEALASFRPSYRMLSYVLGRSCEYSIDPDLPGDDRPDQVSALYEEAFIWAGLRPPL